MTSKEEQLAAEIERIKKGGAEKYHVRNREQKKLFARDRLKLILPVFRLRHLEIGFPRADWRGVLTGLLSKCLVSAKIH